MMQVPFIFPFAHLQRYYFYDAHRNQVVEVAPPVYSALVQWIESGLQPSCDSAQVSIQELLEQGFLKTKRPDVTQHPAAHRLEEILTTSLSAITLQVTQACNLACSYCEFSLGEDHRQHDALRMDWDTMRAGLDLLLRSSQPRSMLSISFYGGEPLLEMKRIQQCVDYLREHAHDRRIRYYITTNGTLLDDENLAFLAKHKFALTLSLDGPEPVQNKNRRFRADGRGSFASVYANLTYMREHYPELVKRTLVNAVVDKEENHAAIEEFFLKDPLFADMVVEFRPIYEHKSVRTYTPGEDFDTAHRTRVFRNILASIRQESRGRSLHLGELQEIRFFAASLGSRDDLGDVRHPPGMCVPGQKKLFMDVRGHLYPCHVVDLRSKVMKIGRVDSGFDWAAARRMMNIGAIPGEDCRNCWAIALCRVCALHLDTLTEFSPDVKRERCDRERRSAAEKLKDYVVLSESGFPYYGKNDGLVRKYRPTAEGDLDTLLRRHFRFDPDDLANQDASLFSADIGLKPRDAVFLVAQVCEAKGFSVSDLAPWTEQDVTYRTLSRYLERTESVSP